MITEASHKNEILSEINEQISELNKLLASVAKSKINMVPFESSWTAGQLIRHISKSISGIAQAMQVEARPMERNPAQRVEELRNLFLDISTKMKSPLEIVPEDGPFDKDSSAEQLSTAFMHLKESADHTEMDELVEGSPLGPITKLELLHVVLYHTQRHMLQMKNICNALA